MLSLSRSSDTTDPLIPNSSVVDWLKTSKFREHYVFIKSKTEQQNPSFHLHFIIPPTGMDFTWILKKLWSHLCPHLPHNKSLKIQTKKITWYLSPLPTKHYKSTIHQTDGILTQRKNSLKSQQRKSWRRLIGTFAPPPPSHPHNSLPISPAPYCEL